MTFAASVSTHPDGRVAAGEILGEVTEKLGGVPDLAVLFASGAHISDLAEMVDATHALLMPQTLIAVTACGTLAGAEEVETGDSFCLWAGETGPNIRVRLETIPGRESIIAGLPTEITPGSVLMVCADPFSFDVEALITQMAAEHPGVGVAGGLASAGSTPGSNQLWIDSDKFTDGAVGVIFPPGVATPIVSQGCRPIGEPWTVTDGDRNMIRSLGGKPALARLSETIEALSPADKHRAATGLHIGFAASDQIDVPEPGDFLVRAVLGGDRKTEAIAVGASVDIGQLVQFQVRDAVTASEELVDQVARGLSGSPEASALVFTCNGRGTRMFAEPHHDAQLISELVVGAVGGMFCAGEVGPVAGRNALHGFTATALLF